MEKYRKIKDSNIYNIYEKLYNIYVNDHYDTIEDFVIDIKNMNYRKDSDVYVILTSLLKKVNDDSQSDYLLSCNFDNHSILLIMVSNTNFIYLLENSDKSFKDVFGTKSQFHLTSLMIDILAAKEIEKLNE